MWNRNSELAKPGEYGRRDKRDGWVKLVIPELNNKIIYLASANFAAKIAAQYNIPPERIVSLISRASLSKKGIPEEILPAKSGLEMFHERLQKINCCNEPVIIHCKQGLNRTPVAAILYLISQNIPPERAVSLVTSAYQQQRDESFVLDKRGHYENVLSNFLSIDRMSSPRKRGSRQ